MNTEENQSLSRDFITIWFGQFASTIGSSLTSFALAVWVYQQTNSVTLLSLLFFAATLPGLLMSPIVGVLVDRFDRRYIMLMSDVVAGVGTVVTFFLLYTNQLNVWYIGIIAMVISIMRSMQIPAYKASVSLLVPENMLGQANGYLQMTEAVPVILSPVLAGVLMDLVQLQGILIIDICTFLIAMVTLFIVSIPKPKPSSEATVSFWDEIRYGWKYLAARSGLMALMVFFLFTNFAAAGSNLLMTPLILSMGSATQLGILLSIFGVGFLIGSIAMGVTGGPKNRIKGIIVLSLLSSIWLIFIGSFSSLITIGVGLFLLGLCIPLINGTSQTILQSKVDPAVQGRVFAFHQMITGASTPIAFLLAGPLADQFFEPLFMENGALVDSVGALIGTGAGRGIGFIFIVFGLANIVFALVAYAYPRLRHVENELQTISHVSNQAENNARESIPHAEFASSTSTD